MAEIRAPADKEIVKQDYLQGMKYKDLAEKYGVSINTIKSWIKRYGWTDEKKSDIPREGAPKNKKGAPLNNKNAVGNPGGGAPVGNKNAEGHGAPLENKNAETHGFFSKYLPEDALKIIQEIETKSPLDILWDQIVIQYTAIIRSQRIMYVTDKGEMIKELKKSKVKKKDKSTEKTSTNESEEEYEYEFQFAWDRQATFLQAQSRAMSELRSMIKQYDEMLKSGLATEEQKLRIEKLKVDIEKVKDGDDNKPIQIVIKRKDEGK
jgi:uncharacterized protein YjcR